MANAMRAPAMMSIHFDRLAGRIIKTMRGAEALGRFHLMAAFILALTGCAGFGATPVTPQYDTAATHDLMVALQSANPDLISCKGLGKVRMTVDGARRTFDRAAWAGAEPGRMRFDARTPFGLPILSLACNESYLTVMAHSEGRYYHQPIDANQRLGKILSVDIACRDLYRLMIGRPPIIDYHSAQMEITMAGESAIVLKRRYRGPVARLFLDEVNGDLTGFELLNVHGQRRYLAQIKRRRTVDGFRLPYQLRLESSQGHLAFDMLRLYPNAPVSASLFHIPPPN